MNFWKNKKVLVTGAGGFIGSNFVSILKEVGANIIGTIHSTKNDNMSFSHNLSFVKLDLLKFDELKILCQDKEIEIIIHCAALDGNIQFKNNESARILDENLKMATNILNVAKELKIKDVMLISSSDLYSASIGKDIISEEDDYRKNFQYDSNGYVLSKIFSEIIGKKYEKQYGIRIYLPRPTNIFGPKDKFEGASNRVIPSIIKKISNNEKIEIWGDGSQIRSFIYVKDLVNICLKIIELKRNDIINISTDESISILELAKIISSIMGVKGNINLDLDKPSGIKKRILDISKLKSILNYSFTSLEKGLKETIKFYLQNKEK